MTLKKMWAAIVYWFTHPNGPPPPIPPWDDDRIVGTCDRCGRGIKLGCQSVFDGDFIDKDSYDHARWISAKENYSVCGWCAEKYRDATLPAYRIHYAEVAAADTKYQEALDNS